MSQDQHSPEGVSAAAATPAFRTPAGLVELRGPALGALLVAALLLVVFWQFFARQFEFAVKRPADWGHTLVIPLIAGYFVWTMRARLLSRPFRTTWIAFVPVLLGVGLYMLCSVGPQALIHHNLQGAGVALTLFGVTLLFCGFRAMLLLWFPLAYLVIFGQTISDRALQLVTFRLQDLTASGSELLFILLGFGVERKGNTLYLINDVGQAHPLNIAEACSGMRMLMAFLALGVAMAYTGLTRRWQQVLVVLMGVPISIFVNVLRVVTLGLLTRVHSDLAAGDFHTFIGLVWLVPAFLLFLGMIWLVRQFDSQGEG